MTRWQHFFADSARTGAIASAATTLVAAICGWFENNSALAPINAVSHIAWGEEAAAQTGFTARYTLTGLALNCAAVTGWAAIYQMIVGPALGQRDTSRTLIGGPTISVLAYVTDYQLVPARLTPGFEKRLSNRSMWCVYSALALGLVLGGLTSSKR